MDRVAVLVLLVLQLFSSLVVTVDCESEDAREGIGRWQSLSSRNFSSQIRLHSHILLLVTVPWSGESRGLMKELTYLVTERSEDFGILKLMYSYKNEEKMIADTVGATEETTILYYHHSSPYKYQGRLRATSILLSILPYMSVFPEEIPLKTLNTQEDLKSFLKSTDMALVLLEFCGWTSQLLNSEQKNVTEKGFGMQGNLFDMGFGKVADRSQTPSSNEDRKGSESTKSATLTCGIESSFDILPWLREFSSLNDSASLQDNEYQGRDKPLSEGALCTFEKFQQFNSFFSKFMAIVREYFLPAERKRFGLVSDKSLLSLLGYDDANSWSLVVYSEGCPSCLKMLEGENELKSAVQMDQSIITELRDYGEDVDPALPANKPSMLLFVDRLSDSPETRRQSKAALQEFREFVLHFLISNDMAEQIIEKSERSYTETSKRKSMRGHPKLQISPMGRKINLKDKMSIMIYNEGKQTTIESIASNLQGSSLHEILTYLLQQKKEAKLSSVAKEVGFQLISHDLDVKVVDTIQSDTEVEPKQVSLVQSDENAAKASVDQGPNSAPVHDKIVQLIDKSSSSVDNIEKSTDVETSRSLSVPKPDKDLSDNWAQMSENVYAEVKMSLNKMGEEQFLLEDFQGSFFFSDGNYRLLQTLTGDTRVPSLVIIDPVMQQHYVSTEQTFNCTSIKEFLYGFLNGNLIPYGRSGSKPESLKEGTHPPFVNLDFHEADSIPQVTSRTFSQWVLGFNKSNNSDISLAWKEDVLVLFSNSWCGFCQRMELVVREVYRALKGYVKMLKTGSQSEEMVFADDGLNAELKVPKIFLMDCTLNDCRSILNSMKQREVFPALLLFPAERKTAISFEGNVAVTDIIRFVAEHGSNTQLLTSDKGILLNVAQKSGQNKGPSPIPTNGSDAVANNKAHEILLIDRMPKRIVERSLTRSQTSTSLHETAYDVVVGSVLTAGEKINALPFTKSMVLIVKADQDTGFQGLIYNKPIEWDSLEGLEEEIKLLREAPLSFGGPLIKRGMPLVAFTRRTMKDQYPEVVPGIYFLDQSATRKEIEELKSGNQSLADYWFFLGFSSWGRDQLFDEIADGAWSLREKVDHIDWPTKLS
ncbi:hypothetical protein K2173_009264 [Erythroxylum novogranatense]|uniref:Thioredoxin domain-containing protein n=1 Tax=Erythroxylum novogranatense TaxID=1862640 RepID=A0AAV8SYY5_9ROSI|nr:hypothetical protein K2173_009264 [Erythroxylum novogranatense]